ncbi:SIS domain-containing protein [Candidatus Nanopelagicales bacterium]|nr:SIS domain-containing protein [Candidatus Nanopelagicales bacterium]
MNYKDRLMAAIEAVDYKAVDCFVDALLRVYLEDATVYVAGNGGSAATASHMATDLGVGSHLRGAGLRMICLSDNTSVVTAISNDQDFEEVYSLQLRNMAKVGDLLVLISASGDSPNLIHAAAVGSSMKLEVVALTGFTGGKLMELADVVIHVPSAVGDYGPVEDVHLSINHVVTELFRERVNPLERENLRG